MSRISLGIAVFQRPERLPGLLRSFEAQTHPPDEILIWDNTPAGLDASTLGTHIHTVILNRPGATNARHNWGSQARFWTVPHATGDIMFFVDDDAILERDTIQHTFQHFNRYGGNCVVGSHTRYFNGEKYLAPHRHPDNSMLVDYVGTMCMMVPRSLFDKEPSLLTIPHECRNVEDLYLSAMARKQGLDLYFIPKKYSIHFDKKDQFMGIRDQKQQAFEWLRRSGWKLLRELDPRILPR